MKHVRLIFNGGLGNQLFQYAVYVYIKTYFPNIHVHADLSSYLYQDHHNGFEVNKIFKNDFTKSIEQTVLKRQTLSQYSHEPSLNRILRLLKLKLCGYKTIYDTQTKTADGLNDAIKNHNKILLAGYFQIPQFSQSVAQKLNELRAPIHYNAASNKILETIRCRNTVSLHIRRGDYLNIPDYQVFNGLKYYYNTVSFFNSRVDNPLYVVFSDDSDWTKANLSIKQDCLFVNCNSGKDAYLDMLLMSECNHNCIANSSLSWWGAWLNRNPEKVVVAPKYWFANKPSREIVPNSWMLLDN